MCKKIPIQVCARKYTVDGTMPHRPRTKSTGIAWSVSRTQNQGSPRPIDGELFISQNWSPRSLLARWNVRSTNPKNPLTGWQVYHCMGTHSLEFDPLFLNSIRIQLLDGQKPFTRNPCWSQPVSLVFGDRDNSCWLRLQPNQNQSLKLHWRGAS